MKISTIGGNVAENSGGLRGLKYGITRNYVMGLEVVLPNGEVMWIGNKCVKDVAGYSLKDVFIGSEGTLGVITKVLAATDSQTGRRRKRWWRRSRRWTTRPQPFRHIIAAQIIPCTLEFLDRMTIHCVEDYAKIGLPLDCEALAADGNRRPSRRRRRRSRADGRDLARKNGAWKCAWPRMTPKPPNSPAPGAALFRAGARCADDDS